VEAVFWESAGESEMKLPATAEVTCASVKQYFEVVMPLVAVTMEQLVIHIALVAVAAWPARMKIVVEQVDMAPHLMLVFLGCCAMNAMKMPCRAEV
jgi:hypothetical protein